MLYVKCRPSSPGLNMLSKVLMYVPIDQEGGPTTQEFQKIFFHKNIWIITEFLFNDSQGTSWI